MLYKMNKEVVPMAFTRSLLLIQIAILCTMLFGLYSFLTENFRSLSFCTVYCLVLLFSLTIFRSATRLCRIQEVQK